ncbi:hypothetical protein NDU88_001322 [Pleurodeles waltl]|uniref:Uncharacterized protein n=1 Tax=Pleurodeles waltl TaxID=8319 RepID=A0AAV7LYA2_PLEWA|nr:hypothetical protein NDU88_001320 [Pleurodeles waltl]KAJ1096178.1 hypothetical protein NDU88_001322 [Pleurodeles waltl]
MPGKAGAARQAVQSSKAPSEALSAGARTMSEEVPYSPPTPDSFVGVANEEAQDLTPSQACRQDPSKKQNSRDFLPDAVWWDILAGRMLVFKQLFLSWAFF